MKEATFYISKNDIAPKSIVEIGFAGEHLSQRIIFNLSDDLLDDYSYYLYITNGGGEFFATDELILSENLIIYDLPNFVTAMSGICSLQLIIKKDERVLFSYPAKIRLLSSAEQTTSSINYLSKISDALSICKNSANLATTLLKTVNDNSAKHKQIVGDIEIALEEIIALEEYYIGGEN